MSELRLASRWERLWAFLIDYAFIWIITFAFFVALQMFGIDLNDEQTTKILDRGLFRAVALLFYFPIFTAIWGATPGKKILKLKVVSSTDKKLSIGRTILREMLGRWLGAIALGHLWIFCNDENKTAWDYLAGSKVIKT